MDEIPTFPPFYKTVNDRELARVRKAWPADRRALLATDIANGIVRYAPTRQRAAKLAGVNAGFVRTVASLPAAEREALELGQISIEALHERARAFRVVRRLGADRIIDVIDAMTAPVSVAAE
jgi:hypothetical protein